MAVREKAWAAQTQRALIKRGARAERRAHSEDRAPYPLELSLHPTECASKEQSLPREAVDPDLDIAFAQRLRLFDGLLLIPDPPFFGIMWTLLMRSSQNIRKSCANYTQVMCIINVCVDFL